MAKLLLHTEQTQYVIDQRSVITACHARLSFRVSKKPFWRQAPLDSSLLSALISVHCLPCRRSSRLSRRLQETALQACWLSGVSLVHAWRRQLWRTLCWTLC